MGSYHFRDTAPQQESQDHISYVESDRPAEAYTPYDPIQQPSPGYMPQGQPQQASQGYSPYSQPQQALPSYASAGQAQPTVLSGHFNSAYAIITPGPEYPNIRGLVTFADIPGGVMVCADVAGLPQYSPASGGKSPIGPFGFHIHEKGNCEIGNPANPFESAGGHWNPTNQPHGNHAGDFPVLVADKGRARMSFILSRFTVDEILGRSVMIHENPDDYRTQPAGNSGKKIACGSIKPWNAFQQMS